MTTSYRTAVREAVKAQLSGRIGIDDDKIITKPHRPLTPEELPAVIIFVDTAKRGAGSDSGRSYVPREVSVVIEAAISSTADAAQDAAEALAESIEDAMEADPTLGNVVNDTRWLESLSDVAGASKTVLGVVSCTYMVSILTHQKPNEFVEFNDDGFDQPPTHVFSNPHPQNPDIIDPIIPPDNAVCSENGCDIPDWQGELNGN